MRSFRASSLVMLLASLASAGCWGLNRQPDYIGNQSVSIDAAAPMIAGRQSANSVRQQFDRGSVVVSN